MRPPILAVSAGFASGLWVALASWGGTEWPCILALGAAVTARRTPVAAAAAVAAAAGWIWGAGALRDFNATCAGRWSVAPAATRAAVLVLLDPVTDGGTVEARVSAAAAAERFACGGQPGLRRAAARSGS